MAPTRSLDLQVGLLAPVSLPRRFIFKVFDLYYQDKSRLDSPIYASRS